MAGRISSAALRFESSADDRVYFEILNSRIRNNRYTLSTTRTTPDVEVPDSKLTLSTTKLAVNVLDRCRNNLVYYYK
jgi:hypothetical protein